MKGNICYKCGKENNWSVKLCGSCGADLFGLEAKLRAEKKTPQKDPESNLIPCADCGKQISIHARACPGCGSPTKTAAAEDAKSRRNKRGNIQGLGCLLMLLSVFAIALSPFLGGPLFFVGIVILIAGFFI